MPTPVALKLFDRIFVVSLASSIERRRHINEHLPASGFDNFTFFEATPADSPAVGMAVSSGEVATFPPCFRCGGLDCGDPNCNNYLIPAQIATFLTYRRLWREIAEGGADRVMVVEDDVIFHPHAARVLNWLAEEVAIGHLPFLAGRACLLRLGWAFCDDHRFSDGPCRVDQVERMANPCHALTREFARALVQRDAGIHQTVDIYQHRLAPRPGESFTVFPPIASELSSTDGVFASTIHPQPVHAQFLRTIGEDAKAQEHERLCFEHTRKKYFRPVLVAGHPRCGTGYTASLCRQLGLDIGHERLGAGGISSWMFAVEAARNPYAMDHVALTRRSFAWKHLVMPVRDLASAAPSVIRDSQYAPPSYDFRREQILKHLGVDLDAWPSALERALWSITSWTRIILAQGPELVFRIEDQHELLRTFLIAEDLCAASQRDVRLDTQRVNADKPYRGVRYPKPLLTAADWARLNAETRREVEFYCGYFGYTLPWEQAERERGADLAR